MSIFKTTYRALSAWALPGWRDWWIVLPLALVAALCVQGYLLPQSVWAGHVQNDPVTPQRVYCSDSSPVFGLMRMEFDPLGSYHQRRRVVEVTSAEGGLRLEYKTWAGHLDQSSNDPLPEPSDWYVHTAQPWCAVDEIMTGGGCLISFERIGWRMFAGQWKSYSGEHFSGRSSTPTPDCYSGEYWVSAPLWSLAGPPLFLMLIRTRGRRRDWIRKSAGHCPSCGYDLRASPDRCPECGHCR